MIDPAALILPAFIAGILTFLAPCTLPLVPAYLGFISGASLEDLKNPARAKRARFRIILNAVFYLVGFSLVFIILGSLFGLGGAALAGYRVWLARIGGLFVIFFGLYMLGLFKLPFLNFLEGERQPKFIKSLKPGNPASSFAFGTAFAAGWSPCVGPILGSLLTLAAATATVTQGAVLLSVFSLGLAIPFLAIAVGIGSASNYINKISKYLNLVSIIGGLLLILLGLLLLTNNFVLFIGESYRLFNFINYDRLLDYL
ncbi:MAG: sulfite exporter TauE/SafE family protein [Candidatus Colwellbacteria bacterium]|nr:sulfite exporter TauE/SafE family protein [Candidatus Colwellbacteria bacterium]